MWDRREFFGYDDHGTQMAELTRQLEGWALGGAVVGLVLARMLFG